VSQDLWNLSIDVRVSDRAELWRLARDYLIDCNSWEEGQERDDVIGSEDDPDVGGCLIMLLDRSEHLGNAAEIENSSSSSQPDWI
jgi:hypothetical protein